MEKAMLEEKEIVMTRFTLVTEANKADKEIDVKSPSYAVMQITDDIIEQAKELHGIVNKYSLLPVKSFSPIESAIKWHGDNAVLGEGGYLTVGVDWFGFYYKKLSLFIPINKAVYETDRIVLEAIPSIMEDIKSNASPSGVKEIIYRDPCGYGSNSCYYTIHENVAFYSAVSTDRVIKLVEDYAKDHNLPIPDWLHKEKRMTD